MKVRTQVQELADEIINGVPSEVLLTTKELNALTGWLEEWLSKLLEVDTDG